MRGLALTLGLVVLGTGCAGTRRPPSGLLVLRVTPAEARVTLDDRYIGSGGQLTGRVLKLDSGVRRLEVTAEGRYGARREAVVAPGGRVELQIDLPAVPDGERDLH